VSNIAATAARPAARLLLRAGDFGAGYVDIRNVWRTGRGMDDGSWLTAEFRECPLVMYLGLDSTCKGGCRSSADLSIQLWRDSKPNQFMRFQVVHFNGRALIRPQRPAGFCGTLKNHSQATSTEKILRPNSAVPGQVTTAKSTTRLHAHLCKLSQVFRRRSPGAIDMRIYMRN
jgi:hypothetical protein